MSKSVARDLVTNRTLHFHMKNRSPHRPVTLLLSVLLLAPAIALAAAATGKNAGSASKPADDPIEQITLSPLVAKLLEDPILTDAQRRAKAVFHGQWDSLKDATLPERAAIALARHEYDAPELNDAQTPALLRAQAALLRGQPERVDEFLRDEPSASASLLRGQALEQLGRMSDAVTLLQPWRDKLATQNMTSAEELTDAAQILTLLARLEGRPQQDFQLALSMFTKAHDELDRLYWPAHVAQARLLDEKDNTPQSFEALTDALKLNTRASEAWYQLGSVLVEGYNFELAAKCVSRLRAIHEQHPLAALLEAQMFLTQRDASSALRSLRPLLDRYPTHRMALALRATAEALTYNPAATQKTLQQFDALSPASPGHAMAYAVMGKYLSLARQYSEAEAALRAAVERSPNWAEPRVELGLLLMQSGDEDAAYKELSAAVALDPFNRRAANQLKLASDLREYARIETPHFIIKYRAGIDEVLANDMVDELEKIHREITAAFRHRPPRKTLIEIMPDDQHFGVRITGMPEIWTIGAATGDVIAITPPRPGARQRGAFDWARVIRHEFVHTVTLSQTSNRIPHWFTEACAVSQEPGGRDYDTAQLLAMAHKHDKLFTLDQINWAFVRPKNPAERPLAYAQAHWMLEYITVTYSHDAVIRLLDLFRRGVGDVEGIQRVTGRTGEQFLSEFKTWAASQLKTWGLAPQPGDKEIEKAMESGPLAPAKFAELQKSFPDHPEIVRANAMHTLESGDVASARELVLRYGTMRPLDPWAYRELVKLSARSGRGDEAVAALEQLDRNEQLTGSWASQLAHIHRASGQLDDAQDAARRALMREPYNATYREQLATIALQRSDTETALRQLQAMTLLEPDRAIHFQRLAAMSFKLGDKEAARTAAQAAKKLDPNAKVERFLE